jgi:hypothetical protein
MDIRNLILTLLRLKHYVSLSFLSFLFSIDKSTASNIIRETLWKLFFHMKQHISIPPINERLSLAEYLWKYCVTIVVNSFNYKFLRLMELNKLYMKAKN